MKKHANDFRAVMRAPFYRRIFPETRHQRVKRHRTGGNDHPERLPICNLRRGHFNRSRRTPSHSLDDPMKPQDAHSAAAREHVQQWYSNTLLPRLDSKADGAIIVVMQRLHEDDLAAHLLQQGNWEALNLPAIADTEQTVPLGLGREYHRKKDEVLHPAARAAFGFA